MAILIIAILLLFATLLFAVFNLAKSKKQYSTILAKYKEVIDLDKYKDQVKTEITSKDNNLLFCGTGRAGFFVSIFPSNRREEA